MRKKSGSIKLILFLSSLLLSFMAAEIGYRIILFSNSSVFDKIREPELYADYFSEDDYWKLYYRFGGQWNPPEHPHPVLGWIGDFSRDTYIHNKTEYIGDRRAVLMYGDSFAQCAQSVLCFQDILNDDKSFSRDYYLLNYGVGGYGTDQIFLLFQNSVDYYDNPFVVISLMTLDLDRSILSVRIGQKPYFRVEGNNLKLYGTPVNSDPYDFFTANPPQIKSYLYRRILYGNYLSEQTTSFLKGEKEYTREKIQVNEKIILKIVEALQAKNIDYVFLIFHPHWPGVSPLDSNSWRDSFLKQLLDENNIPYIWSKELIMQHTTAEMSSFDEFFIPDNGHPTTFLNRLIAEEIKRYVLDEKSLVRIRGQEHRTLK